MDTEGFFIRWLKMKRERERAERLTSTGIELRISVWKSSVLTTEKVILSSIPVEVSLSALSLQPELCTANVCRGRSISAPDDEEESHR